MTIDGQFWSVVEAGECVGADDVRGLKLAVDLSIWLVEAASSAALAEAHAKPHLFLVFSRAVFLLKRGCRLVCVLDGERDPRKRWRDGRGNGASGSRRRLDDAGREAALLLHGLGVPTFVASGEAEAMCARLQLAGLVDGVVTEDGDAFAYGAAAVYRDFTVGALRAGRARVYRLGADSSLSSHRGVVAFAVVVGTDLWPGVGGVGAKKAMLFLRRCAAQGVDALDMLRQWRDARPAAATLATDDAATRRVVDAVLAHCKAHAFPLEALLRTYLQPPTEELLLAPQIAWRWPSLRALRFVNALTVVAGHRKHTSCAFVTDHVMPLLT